MERVSSEELLNIQLDVSLLMLESVFPRFADFSVFLGSLLFDSFTVPNIVHNSGKSFITPVFYWEEPLRNLLPFFLKLFLMRIWYFLG